MKEEELLEILNTTSAIQAGHFLLSSGLHSEQYIQLARVFQYPKFTARIANALAENFRLDRPAIVIGIAMGGIILAYETARVVGARAMFAERENGKLVLKRGFEIKNRERVLIVEDVLTTGKSVLELKELIKVFNPLIVGVGAVIDRCSDKFKIRNKYHYLLKYKLPTYTPEDCPLCKKEIPLVKPGSR
ncbi:MAG: orotate phosphoribosyltransferase [Candidatus Omnitrophica bacterium 4484_49]|nr:orotate phosphoribosyltransferase [Candidatus Omnitrophota bacterium]OQX82541.1 MAG: orotate phosphoribosyltransferase [Candidatus Omnitrophica bacterium 4484_49]